MPNYATEALMNQLELHRSFGPRHDGLQRTRYWQWRIYIDIANGTEKRNRDAHAQIKRVRETWVRESPKLTGFDFPSLPVKDNILTTYRNGECGFYWAVDVVLASGEADDSKEAHDAQLQWGEANMGVFQESGIYELRVQIALDQAH